jgi:hypothetical protein
MNETIMASTQQTPAADRQQQDTERSHGTAYSAATAWLDRVAPVQGTATLTITVRELENIKGYF